MSSKRSVRPAVEYRDGVLTTVKALLEITACSLFLVTFVLQPFRIPSASMEPTLRVGDFLLVDKQSYGPTGISGSLQGELSRVLPPAQVERGDLVVFHYPVDHTLHLVKRVVGMPGDHLRLRGGHVLVNGRPLQEAYAFYSRSRPNGYRDDFPSLLEADPNVDLSWWIELRRTVRGGDVVVPAGEYFVLGDNRNNSEDSRYWGFVPRDAIVGRPLLVYFTLPLAEEMHGESFWERARRALQSGVRSWRVLR